MKGPIAQALEETPVSRLMTDEVVAVEMDMDLDALAELLLAEGLSGVPVVNAEGQPIGVVSKTDLVREHHEAHRFGDELDSPRVTVGDVMMQTPFRISARASLADAATFFARESLHRLPVVADDGRVVGMLSTLDIVRWLAEQSVR